MRQKKTSTRSMPPSTATAISSGRTRTTNPTADGMYGQYIVVVPKSKAVVTVQALDRKKFFDDVWSELVVPFLNKG